MMMTGANLPIGKVVAGEMPVYIFTFFRFLVSCAALMLLVRVERGPTLRAMPPRRVVDLIGMALFGMIGYTVFMLEGVKRTAAGDAGIITATMPAVVAILGLLILRERLRANQMVAVVLAVAGIAVIQVAGVSAGVSTLVGNVLVAAAVLCEALFVILGKRLTPTYQPIRLALGANLAGLVMAAPLALSDVGATDLTAISPGVWALATWYALSSSVFCLLLWYRGLPHVSTALAGLATAAIPVTALAVSAMALGEPVGPEKLAGAALVIAGIVIGARARPLRRR